MTSEVTVAAELIQDNGFDVIIESKNFTTNLVKRYTLDGEMCFDEIQEEVQNLLY